MKKKREVESGRESKLPLSCSQNVLYALVWGKLHHRHKLHEPQSHFRECMMYGPRWPTTPNTHLQRAAKLRRLVHTLCQVCVSCEKWASRCLRPLRLKVSPPRLKPRRTELLHTTPGPDTIQSAAHFSPHFLYIIHTINHIKFSARHRAVRPALNDEAICARQRLWAGRCVGAG